MDIDKFDFNGIDGDNGEYLLPGMSLDRLGEIARKASWNNAEGRGVRSGVVLDEISSSGWGIVLPLGLDPQIRDALAPLVESRRGAAGGLFKEFYLRPGESKGEFLTRHRSLPMGPVDPRRIPFYLLLIGSPRQISYSFQYDLSVQYGVGRVFFDTPEEYGQYARGVLEAEARAPRSRRAVLFAPNNSNDSTTAQVVSHLVEPLAEDLATWPWSTETLVGEEATKSNLKRVLGGDQTPALLFSVSHGLGFKRRDHPRKKTHQGALIANDWPGPGHSPLATGATFAAEDLSDDADVSGMIAFLMACWSGGTPKMDCFTPDKQIAEEDFIARLPQRLLAHPRGGALAVVAHVDRAMLFSFLWSGTSQVTLFESVLADLMSSMPVGWAMRYLGEYSAELANDLLQIRVGEKTVSDQEYARLWAAYQDGRGYLILGDPSVRLRFSGEEARP